MSKVFVFDLDGVIRHWDPDIVAVAEREHGLPPGTLLGTAFEPELLLSVVTGVISDDAWRSETARRLHHTYPEADSSGAVAAWSTPHGEVIAGAMDVLTQARAKGRVCLLTNATDRLPMDLTALGLADAFDVIFNSSHIGFAKPDPRVYAHVERALATPPNQIIYIDDGVANIRAAADGGWISLLATPETDLLHLLRDHV